MNESRDKKFGSREIYALVFFIIVIATALALKVISQRTEKFSSQNPAPKQNKNLFPEEFSQKSPSSPPIFRTGKIQLIAKNNFPGEGSVSVSDSEVPKIFGYFQLPDVMNGFEYSAWLYKNELEEYKKLTDLAEVFQDMYFLEYSLDRTLFDFHDIIILLSPQGGDPASGTIILRGSLKQ